MALLEIESLRIGFDTDRGFIRAVNGVSLQVQAGQTLGLVGESGSGKSVTGLAVMRLLPQPPGKWLGGAIRFAGQDIKTLKRKDLQALRGRAVGYVFQDPLSALNPVMRVGEQLMEGLCAHERVSRSAGRARVIEALRAVGLPDPEDRFQSYPHELSGGMRQRAMIAMAVLLRPQLLIADEPTTALDVTVQAQIIELFRELKRTIGMAVLLISHDIGVVAQLADSLAVMRAGEVVEQGPLRQVLTQPQQAYTRELLAAVPRWEQGSDAGAG
jgi:ABC-type dipeptide/oligopeptide/nickel transport system ATPase component